VDKAEYGSRALQIGYKDTAETGQVRLCIRIHITVWLFSECTLVFDTGYLSQVALPAHTFAARPDLVREMPAGGLRAHQQSYRLLKSRLHSLLISKALFV